MRKAIEYAVKSILIPLSYIIPRDNHKIVFGAWNGWSYSDNPRYIFEFLFEHAEWNLVWIGEAEVAKTMPRLPNNARFVPKGSFKSVFHLLTAGSWIFSHSVSDLSGFPLWGRALLLDTAHGTAMKKLGQLTPAKTAEASPCNKHGIFRRVKDRILRKKIYQVVTSDFQAHMIFNGYPGLFQPPALPFGSPSIDYIIRNKDNSTLKNSLRKDLSKRFSLPLDKKWIVYAPTFRWTVEKNFSFKSLEAGRFEKLNSILERKNAVLLEKLHPRVIPSNQFDDETLAHPIKNRIYSITGPLAKSMSPHNLWLASDMLITDYSSCANDFHFLGKPVIHFAYDLDYYAFEDSGLIHDISDIKFGPVVETIEDLFRLIEGDWSTFSMVEGSKIDDLIQYENGDACFKYLHFISFYHFCGKRKNRVEEALRKTLGVCSVN